MAPVRRETPKGVQRAQSIKEAGGFPHAIHGKRCNLRIQRVNCTSSLKTAMYVPGIQTTFVHSNWSRTNSLELLKNEKLTNVGHEFPSGNTWPIKGWRVQLISRASSVRCFAPGNKELPVLQSPPKKGTTVLRVSIHGNNFVRDARHASHSEIPAAQFNRTRVKHAKRSGKISASRRECWGVVDFVLRRE